MKTQPEQKCKKLVFKQGQEQDSPTIILGVVVEDGPRFLQFQTARRFYIINKDFIISLEDTDVIFKSGGVYG